jgi:hypothetical protein
MLSQISHLKLLLQNFENYIKTDAELLKLKSINKSADIISSIFAFIIIIIAVIIFTIILSIGLSFLIGRLLGSVELGFFVISACWAIICSMLYFLKNKWLKNPSQDVIVKKILD